MSKIKATPKNLKVSSPKLSTVNGTSSKETIYVDVDDEITTIIDKVSSSKSTIIALVLPKRASVMQSVVNMKLLKRTAENGQKNIVLVTSEASLMPLAGMVGMHVAQTPTSKPVIPPAPDALNDEPENVDETLEVSALSESAETEFDPAAAATVPIGQLAGASNDPEEIIDETVEVPELAGSVEKPEKPEVTPVKRDKKLAVPNFNAFRLRFMLAGLALILLGVGWFFATVVLPKATISIKTNSQLVKSSLNLTLDTAAKKIDLENKIVPAIAQTTQKNFTQQVAATGQQNNGTRATGSVRFTATQCAPNLGQKPDAIPVGSSVTSGGKTYITQEKASYSFDSFTSGSCALYSTDTIKIQALKGGADYNLSDGAKFTGAGLGIGSASGGTDAIIKIVSQTDIDTAKSKIATQDTTQVKQDLQVALKNKGVLPVVSTFLSNEPQVTSSAKAGDVADTVTVTATVGYSMLGLQQSDLKKLVLEDVNDRIDQKKQKILDDGVAKAVFTQQNPGTTTTAIVAVQIRAVAGPELSVEGLKKQVAGKKAGEIKSTLGERPGVTETEVSYSPFWVTTAPKNPQKITINIAQPSAVE